jgi:hypothetical protein
MVFPIVHTVRMPREPDPFGIDYLTELVRCYEGEVAGEAYFTALATWHEGSAVAVLRRFAEVERVTAATLLPIVRQRGLTVADADDLRARGEANAAAERSIGWDDLIAEMCEYYPRYVREFELMLAITPVEDRAAVQLLLDHEVALVDTAIGVRAGRPDALAPVERFLATAPSPT